MLVPNSALSLHSDFSATNNESWAGNIIGKHTIEQGDKSSEFPRKEGSSTEAALVFDASSTKIAVPLTFNREVRNLTDH